jgi:hypothetical protein
MFSHIVALDTPMSAVAEPFIVIVIVDTASLHSDAAFAVSVSVTVPELISAALGVYTGCNMVLSLKLPVPDVAHARLVWYVALELLSV